MNTETGKDEYYNFCLYNWPNKNGKYLTFFHTKTLNSKKGRENYGPTPTQNMLKYS